jgi:hypothetical protein
MRIMRFACWLLSAGILLGGLSAASAQEQGSVDVRQACTPDAMRLCSEFIPDEGKVKTCMLRKRAQLSEPCRLAMRGGAGHGGRHYRRHYRHHK